MSTTPAAASPAPVARALGGTALLPRLTGWLPAVPMLGTYAFVLWATFITADPVSIGGIPFKLVLLMLALGLWLPNRTGRPIPFTIPVLVVAIGFPIVWSLVALFYPHPYAGMDPSPTQMTLRHASRFLYLLIYLPIADYTLHASARRAVRMWVLPVFGLIALTWLIFVLYRRLGVDLPVTLTTSGPFATSQLGPLLGVVTPPGVSPARIFFANHILIIPAISVLLAWLTLADPRQRWWALATVLVALAVVYPIQSRGLTIGVLAVVLTTAGLSWRTGSAWPAALLCMCVAGLLSTGLDARAAKFLAGDRSDASSQDRVVQEQPLLDGFKEHPIMGSGLGATLPSGFISSPEPYQFELSYHQILFQNGIVGLAMLLGLPLLACLRCLMALRHLRRQDRIMTVAGIAGLLGLLVAGATSPFLISSYGMLAITVALALCARAIHLARETRIRAPVF